MIQQMGLTWVKHLCIISLILLIAALVIPGLISSQRASSERKAATMLKMLSAVEADFRANDRDGNGVNDFWTADVKGLYTMTRANAATPLISLDVAAADGDDTFYSAGGKNLPLSRFARPEPMGGYWFMALVSDKSADNPAERPYKVDTKGAPAMGAVHHPSKFGFVLFPDTPKAGEYVFRLNEGNCVYREWIRPREKPGSAGPGFQNIPPWFLEWPSDEELKKHFGCGNFCCRDYDQRR